MIDGVKIKKLTKNMDNRGFLIETYRKDEDKIIPEMSYISHTNFGIVRGPHEHKYQTDIFVFAGYGDFELYLWDNNKNSKTYPKHMKIIVGETKPATVFVPPGVVHGYKAISKKGSLCINIPDKLYKGENKKEEVDEIRHENDKDSKFKIL